MNWFGKKKTATAAPPVRSKAPSNPTQTITVLKTNIANQEKREAHIQKKIDALTEDAKKKLAAKDKKGAMYAMKRRKMHENELEKIEQVKMTLETQVMNLESAAQNAETFQAMKQGTDAMKQIRTNVGIENVEDMMDDIREEMDMANEITNAIAAPVDPYAYDEDDLMAELEGEMAESEAELLESKLTSTDDIAAPSLPSVPNSKLPAVGATTDEEEELKKLEAELAAAM